MQFIPNTLLGLFDSTHKSYQIPAYQRTYAWDLQNWQALLNDLLKQVTGGNNYFIGNILLEEISKNRIYEIVDGGQRLITVTMLINAILNELESRHLEPELSNVNIEQQRHIFLKQVDNIKLRPLTCDRACYDSLIIDNDDIFLITTPSQNRIKKAKAYFKKEVISLEITVLLDLLENIENTELTITILEGKNKATLMFERENNRGKARSNMDELKSYFMSQMYACSSQEESDANIEEISNTFKQIYLIIHDLKQNEDDILTYHNNAYINGFWYESLDDVKELFKQAGDKTKWIKSYINDLHTTFTNIQKFEKSMDKFAYRLNWLGTPAFAYPFIIKGYAYFADEPQKLTTLFQLLEIVSFRVALINSRADIQGELNDVLQGFNGDLTALIVNIKNTLNDSQQWSDSNFENHLNGNVHGNCVLMYILWLYEISLPNKGLRTARLPHTAWLYEGLIKSQVSNKSKFIFRNDQIEHISPQTPSNDEPIKAGYDLDEKNQYSQGFINSKLHCLGNMMLVSGCTNDAIGNQPFSEKLASYKRNPILNQQAEIEPLSMSENDQPIWNSQAIDKRHEKIVKFAIDTWNLNDLKVE